MTPVMESFIEADLLCESSSDGYLEGETFSVEISTGSSADTDFCEGV